MALCGALLPLLLAAVAVVMVTPGHRGLRGGALAMAENCSSADTVVVGKEGVRTIIEAKPDGQLVGEVVYVRFEQGFQGVMLIAQEISSFPFYGNHWTEKAWFTIDKQCLPANEHPWMMMQVFVRVTKKTIWFLVLCGECLWKCSRHGTFNEIEKFTLKANGSSSWRNSRPPANCPTKESLSNTLQVLNCTRPSVTTSTPPPTDSTAPPTDSTAQPTDSTAPPSTYIPPPSISSTPARCPSSTVLIIIGLGLMTAIVVVLAVVLGILMSRWRQQRGSPEKHSVNWRSQTTEKETHGSRNSLYEPCDNYVSVAAAAGDSNSQHGSHNSLYEPCDNYTSVAAAAGDSNSQHGSHNSLYEPCDNYVSVAAGPEHGKSLHGMEDTIYENVAEATNH